MPKSPWVAVAAVTAGLVTGNALAQAAPDAGQLLQNQRTKPAELPRKGGGAELATPPQTLAVSPGTTVTVKSFRFQGNTLLDDARLQRVVTPYLDRKIDFKELQEATAQVAKRYLAEGRLARAFLPAQDVTNGQVTIQILEARYGGAQVEQSGQRLAPEQARAMMEQGQVRGEALDLIALDRALLLVGDLPGVKASASLVPGGAPGETAVVVNLRDQDAVTGQVGADNAGTRSTGAARVNASVALNSALGVGDQFTAQASQSQGSSFVRVGASAPVGPQGVRLGVNASALRYRLVGSDFDALKARGTASSLGLEAGYPLIRSRDRNLLLKAEADSKRFTNKANGAEVSDYKSESLTLAALGNEFDDLGGGGASTAYFGLQFGRLDLDGSPSQALDAAGARTDGSFRKLRYQLSRSQTIAGDFSVYGALQGQWASRNLDSSERFYLGGPQGVRAYPVSEAGGAIGQLVTAELRWRLGNGWRVAGFADWGHVKTHVDPNFVGAATPNAYSLKGAGLSVDYAGSGGLDASLIWARRIGDNPNADVRGRDQDGSFEQNRFWLLISQQF
ncbi:MAG TPA: ShlB/FhaC/HecB family hemolysin secretion/activation protein [Roseateles sp.]